VVLGVLNLLSVLKVKLKMILLLVAGIGVGVLCVLILMMPSSKGGSGSGWFPGYPGHNATTATYPGGNGFYFANGTGVTCNPNCCKALHYNPVVGAGNGNCLLSATKVQEDSPDTGDFTIFETPLFYVV
jgi:hypothetical protein